MTMIRHHNGKISMICAIDSSPIIVTTTKYNSVKKTDDQIEVNFVIEIGSWDTEATVTYCREYPHGVEGMVDLSSEWDMPQIKIGSFDATEGSFPYLAYGKACEMMMIILQHNKDEMIDFS